MTTRKALELETITLVALSAFFSGIFVLNNNRVNLPVVYESSQLVEPLSKVASKVDTASQISPDGTKTLEMRVTRKLDGSSIYVFSTFDSGSSNKIQIFSATVTDEEEYSVPFNAWSPDNKYVFIYKGINAYIFNASGKPIGNEPYIDLASEFSSKNTTHTLTQVTGWADPALVIFNTLDKDGNKVSFWLELPSKVVIPLSTQF